MATNKNTIGNILQEKMKQVNKTSELLNQYQVYYNPANENSKIRKQKERIQRYDKNILTPMQQHYYDEATKGFKIYTKETLYQMNSTKKNKIKKKYSKVQRLINQYKWEKTIELSNSIFGIFFHSELMKQFKEEEIAEFNNTLNVLSFKDLNIEKMDIVNLLFDNKILPSNFFNLKN